ncbi:MAG: hypothetical protein KA807_13390 [Prolixibacteraceae bacterium]|nr:hypothetical protein [Prolixibacteraceae bacterium]
MNLWIKGILLMFLSLFCFLQVNAQNTVEKKDTVDLKNEITVKRHIPGKATAYSAVLPGLGQIYNKKWWKVPFIYGGFGALGYYINQNHKYYLDYKRCYMDVSDDDPSTAYYKEMFPDYNFDDADISSLKDMFEVRIDSKRRQRDLFIIITAGFYLLNIMDANIDAHFLDFDISEDLTFNFEPVFVDPITNSIILGGQLAITF